MIKRIIKWSALWLIIIGCISFAVSQITGESATILQQKTINYGNGLSITMYTLDTGQYLRDIDLTLGILQEDFKGMFNPPPMFFENSTLPELLSPKILINILLQCLNCWIWAITVIIVAPTKLLLYPIVLALTLLGINTEKWGIIGLVKLIYRWNFTYYNYI